MVHGGSNRNRRQNRRNETDGLDLGMWALDDANDPKSRQGLRYEQLVPVLIKAVQELSAQVRALMAESHVD